MHFGQLANFPKGFAQIFYVKKPTRGAERSTVRLKSIHITEGNAM